MRRLLVPTLLAVSVACSPSARRDERLSEAAATLDVVAAHPVFAAALSKRTTLARHGDTFVSPLHAVPLHAALPSTADGVVRIETERPGEWVRIVAADVASTAGVVEGNAVVHRGAIAGGDVVRVVEPSRVEELRVLHRVQSDIVGRYTLELGPGFAEARIRKGRVELVAHDGRVSISADPPFAEDARGRRAAVQVSLQGTLLTLSLDARELTPPIVIDPAWTSAPSMVSARHMADAIVTATGKVLVVGGGVSTAELYDPAANTWSSAGTLPENIERVGALRFLAPAAGGRVVAASSTMVAVWNGATTWTSAPLPPTPRSTFTVTGLADGRVLLVGGRPPGSDTSSLVDVFDATTSSWTSSSSLTAARERHAAVLLTSGKVLVTGGGRKVAVGIHTLSSSEIFDPTTGAWTAGPSLSLSRQDISAARLADGRVLAAGGYFRDATYANGRAARVRVGRCPSRRSAQPEEPAT